VTMLRKQIDPDIQALTEINRYYWWIPNETSIRPSVEVLEKKAHTNILILSSWWSLRDFILHTHFKQIYYIASAKKCILNIEIDNSEDNSEWCFKASMFPYDLGMGANHYVLWNALVGYDVEFSEYEINDRISRYLKKIVGSNEFDFAWYKNPKPSIPELWHAQVFWIQTARAEEA
jgi:hypothetical protein